MTHGLWPLLAWATEFILEVAGWLVWRRRNRLVALFFGVSALFDLVTFGISRIFGDYAYAWASWGAEAVSYALLSLLACHLAALMVREHKPIWHYAGFLSVAGAVVSTVIFRNAPSWDGKFLDAEIAAGCYICVLLLVAWVCQENTLVRPWRSIAWGVAIVAAGNSLCAGLWRAHLAGPMLYFVPEILGLAILAWAGWKDWKLEKRLEALKAEEFRMPIPSVFEYVEAMHQEMERRTGAYLPPMIEKPGDRTATALEAMRQKYSDVSLGAPWERFRRERK